MLASRQCNGLQTLDQRVGLDGCQLAEAFARAMHHGNQRKVFCHVDQMRQGGAMITLAPFDQPFKRLVHELSGHDAHHDFAQHRNEHGYTVQ
ncbi:hypothetical protein D3C76_676400 [compost metagenome]